MPSAYTPTVQALIDEFGRLPGIGPKSAQRIAFHLLKIPDDDVKRLARAIVDAKDNVRFCSRCFNVADAELCPICADPRRDDSVVCVVEESRDRLVGLGHVRHVRFRRHLQVDRAEAIHREIVGVVGQDVGQTDVVVPGVGHAA